MGFQAVLTRGMVSSDAGLTKELTKGADSVPDTTPPSRCRRSRPTHAEKASAVAHGSVTRRRFVRQAGIYAAAATSVSILGRRAMSEVSPATAPKKKFPSRAYLVSPRQVDPALFKRLLDRDAQALVVVLSEDHARQDYTRIQRQVREAGLPLYGWIEVARNPQLAEAHPQWMSSLGMHPDWRRLFPDFPAADPQTVVKAFPWVPIWYEEAYRFHLDRVRRLLEHGPSELDGLFLNDIQSGPSSCGCGNDQCRWAIDYRVPSTATKLEAPETPARFVGEVRELIPDKPVIPVWCTECERIDQHGHPQSTGYCGTVGCYDGVCWPNYARQLMPLADGSAELIAVPTFYKAFDRDLPRYDPEAGWILAALQTFENLPALTDGKAKPIESQRLVTVLQGWNVSEDQIDAQLRRSQEAKSLGAVVALTPIDQSWQPQKVPRGV